ncbi:molybdopterin-dependent oxidoreductase [Hoeflea ulvae]|uniref:Molybdopterin-dependent oxidoreductase n=1 Tax=Hoeflea ulvae TaxID=2983764 RepID=A0ABT3YLS0_9HYPH|nr:molybdopterin-dependent oxidoreductase [Hoeflea ulvae]MCY0096849.1 molybdopterin-dependent oxidoreductase [Hoeflea ulvae]
MLKTTRYGAARVLRASKMESHAMNRLTALSIGAALAAFTAITNAGSTEMKSPGGEPVLTVSGDIGTGNADGTAAFDMEMLKALPATTFSTSTIWTEGVRQFTGVQLSDLIEAVDADGSTLKATAINDYAVEIPFTDAVDGGPIIAYEIDGKEMSVREKGPLWIVYPYDANGKYRSETVYSRSIWQLNAVEVQP